MKEDVNEKRLALIRSVLALSDEEVLRANFFVEPDATTKSHEGTGHPNEPPPEGEGG